MLNGKQYKHWGESGILTLLILLAYLCMNSNSQSVEFHMRRSEPEDTGHSFSVSALGQSQPPA
jgi:hypothetical protein